MLQVIVMQYIVSFPAGILGALRVDAEVGKKTEKQYQSVFRPLSSSSTQKSPVLVITSFIFKAAVMAPPQSSSSRPVTEADASMQLNPAVTRHPPPTPPADEAKTGGGKDGEVEKR